MRRLAATIRCDLRIQLRNGFYYASALVVVGMVVLLRWLPADAVAWLLPIVIFENVLINTFYFAGGLILLEKGEGTLEAQHVTPLRTGEYLASKVITLVALSLVESLLIATLAEGFGPGLVALAAGVTLLSVLLCLTGIAIVTAYRSINEYIMPSVLYTGLLSLPLLGYFGIGARTWYEWHPAQGAIDLMQARVEPPGPLHVAVAIAVPLLWIGPVYFWSRRALRRSALR